MVKSIEEAGTATPTIAWVDGIPSNNNHPLLPLSVYIGKWVGNYFNHYIA
jgi:hypothetical protein